MPCAPHKHKPKRTRAKRRAGNSQRKTQATKIRSTARWQRLRLSFLRAHPLCEDPIGLHGEDTPIPATQVHHIVGINEAPERAYQWANLAGLCRTCHNKIEARERRGRSTAALFAKSNAEREIEMGH